MYNSLLPDACFFSLTHLRCSNHVIANPSRPRMKFINMKHNYLILVFVSVVRGS